LTKSSDSAQFSSGDGDTEGGSARPHSRSACDAGPVGRATPLDVSDTQASFPEQLRYFWSVINPSVRGLQCWRASRSVHTQLQVPARRTHHVALAVGRLRPRSLSSRQDWCVVFTAWNDCCVRMLGSAPACLPPPARVGTGTVGQRQLAWMSQAVMTHFRTADAPLPSQRSRQHNKDLVLPIHPECR
jgi:hypothetical protein